MDAERFAKGYEREPQSYADLSGQEWRTARDALIDPPVRWSHFFSHVIDSYLSAGPIDVNDVQKNITLYTGNTTRHLLRNIAETTERATLYKPALAPHLNRMNFHTINQEMGASWRRLLDPEAHVPLDYIHLAAIQARLSVHAMRLVETRRDFYKKLIAETPQPPQDSLSLDQSFVGRITEIDTAVTLLQVIKERPIDEVDGLTILPAPSKYDAFQGKALDFLILDTEQWQAHGIQVKTRVWDPSKYDPEYVSFVDGTVDLNNYHEKDLPDGRVQRQPIPGLIAADYLLNSEDLSRYSGFSKLPEFAGTFGPIYHARETASTMQAYIEETDRASRAAATIGPRLIQALRRTDAQE